MCKSWPFVALACLTPLVITLGARAQNEPSKVDFIEAEPVYSQGCTSLSFRWQAKKLPATEAVPDGKLLILTPAEGENRVNGVDATFDSASKMFTVSLAYDGQCPGGFNTLPKEDRAWPLEVFAQVKRQSGSKFYSTHLRIPKTVLDRFTPSVSKLPTISNKHMAAYDPYLFVSFETSPAALTMVESDCAPSSDIKGGTKHVHVLLGAQTGKDCNVDIVFLDSEGKKLGPPIREKVTVTKLPPPDLDVQKIDQKFAAAKFKFSQKNMTALKYSVVRGDTIITPEKDVPLTEDTISVPAEYMPKAAGYRLRLRGYSATLWELQRLAPQEKLFRDEHLLLERGADFDIPGPLKPKGPFTITLSGQNLKVSTETDENTTMYVGYSEQTEDENKKSVVTEEGSKKKPSVTLAMKDAAAKGLDIKVYDPSDQSRSVETSLKIAIEVPKGNKAATMSHQVTAGGNPKEKIEWKDIAKTGLGAVIKFLLTP
jgi:hypothetical protein